MFPASLTLASVTAGHCCNASKVLVSMSLRRVLRTMIKQPPARYCTATHLYLINGSKMPNIGGDSDRGDPRSDHKYRPFSRPAWLLDLAQANAVRLGSEECRSLSALSDASKTKLQEIKEARKDQTRRCIQGRLGSSWSHPSSSDQLPKLKGFRPKVGLLHDGLYQVEDSWLVDNNSGVSGMAGEGRQPGAWGSKA
ncbi:hypothetical protein J1614_005796 [Plenodomus biglobosus]|nr:hypothetical protein J1614_005796 [Plenodomus biglobosus]